MIRAWRHWRARSCNARGMALEDAGEAARAEQAYLEATRLHPEWEAPWFNLGLLYKRARRWPESLEFNLKALERRTENPPALWNLGVAATALERWDVARSAWSRYGIPMPAGEGPPDADWGPVPIRVNPVEHPEVVWCQRLDPARTVIMTVPTASSRRRWRDLLLNDGQANGHRHVHGREVPVFDELQVLKPSPAATFEALVTSPSEKDSEVLEGAFFAIGWAAEDWTANLRNLCQTCSEGRPDSAHRHERRETEWTPTRRFGIAADALPTVTRVLEEWARQSEARGVNEVERVL